MKLEGGDIEGLRPGSFRKPQEQHVDATSGNLAGTPLRG